MRFPHSPPGASADTPRPTSGRPRFPASSCFESGESLVVIISAIAQASSPAHPSDFAPGARRRTCAAEGSAAIAKASNARAACADGFHGPPARTFKLARRLGDQELLVQPCAVGKRHHLEARHHALTRQFLKLCELELFERIKIPGCILSARLKTYLRQTRVPS